MISSLVDVIGNNMFHLLKNVLHINAILWMKLILDRLHNTLQIDNKKCIEIIKNYLTPKQAKQIKTKIVKKYKYEEKMNKMDYKDDNKIKKAKNI